MKCDELKEWTASEIEEYDDARLELAEDGKIDCTRVYIKADADKVIEELKSKLEDAKATAYAESVDAGMRERKLKRALWLARAWSASNKYQMFCFSDIIGDLMNVHGFIKRFKGCNNMRNSEEWQQVWENVERKCIKKAEEYK